MRTDPAVKACDAREAALVELLFDGGASLGTDAKRELEDHVGACAGCRAALDDLREGHALLASTRDEPAPLLLAGFAARTADRAEAFRDRSWRGLWWSLTRGMRLASLVSTASLAAAVLLVAFHERPVDPAGPAAPVVAPVAVAVEDEPDDPEETDDATRTSTDALVRQAMRDPAGIGYDSAFAALDDDALEEVLQQLESGG